MVNRYAPRRTRCTLLVATLLVALAGGCGNTKTKTEAKADPGVDAALAPAPVATASTVASASPRASEEPAAAPSAKPAAPVPAKNDGCIHVDEDSIDGDHVELEGVLSSGKHGHPNGMMFDFWVLTLPAPRCVVGISDTPSVTELQLAPDDKDRATMKKLEGKKVHVTGEAFAWFTAWHVRPVVIRTSGSVAAVKTAK
jgi:hypothetical protein